jgi:hypothetical protein
MRNQLIYNEMVSYPLIFSGMNLFLVNLDFNCVVRDDMVMNQFILLPKPYKIVSSETMMHRLVSLTQRSTDEVS